jgi:hypothetical protein
MNIRHIKQLMYQKKRAVSNCHSGNVWCSWPILASMFAGLQHPVQIDLLLLKVARIS